MKILRTRVEPVVETRRRNTGSRSIQIRTARGERRCVIIGRMVKKLDLLESNHGCGLNGTDYPEKGIPKRKSHNVTRSIFDA